MKNWIGLLSKNKGCLFFLPRIYQPPEYYTMIARKIFFLPSLGATALPAPRLLCLIWDCWNCRIERKTIQSAGVVNKERTTRGETNDDEPHLKTDRHSPGSHPRYFVFCSVKKCMEYEVEAVRPRGRPKKTWTEVVQKDCRERKLNREGAMDCSRWRKQIKDDWWLG